MSEYTDHYAPEELCREHHGHEHYAREWGGGDPCQCMARWRCFWQPWFCICARPCPLPHPCPRPEPCPPPRKFCCVEVEHPPVCAERTLCARVRIPAYRCVDRICMVLLEPCRRRRELVVVFKLTVKYIDLTGCPREYCTVVRVPVWDVDCCRAPSVQLSGELQYELGGSCLRLRQKVLIRC